MAVPAIVIMCKAPVSGCVKTRLMTAFSADDAARIHMAMASTVIRRAQRLFDHVSIAADDPEHPFFAQFGLPVLVQGEGSLGQRMARLLKLEVAACTRPVLFLGTDSPHMDDARLQEAARHLNSHDVVIGPVEDGGYDLIALSGDWPVFDAVEWSSGLVLEQTLANCERLGLSCHLLTTSFDIDTPEDLARAGNSDWNWKGHLQQ
ncbi:MAG TPA: TIGR04282 family arsenosugar biosynthesis glycosyltransferase [Mariprofundaceae bacterium]|nr:TIGR04282 family arsenosugar biosynthesis glycosyltransferase [Mariprofundaceae bacterium]